MASRDYVTVNCPKCGDSIIFSSKARGSDAAEENFTLGGIPAEIAGDLHNEYEACDSCYGRVRLMVQCVVLPVYES